MLPATQPKWCQVRKEGPSDSMLDGTRFDIPPSAALQAMGLSVKLSSPLLSVAWLAAARPAGQYLWMLMFLFALHATCGPCQQ